MRSREQAIENSLFLVENVREVAQLTDDEKQRQHITRDELENDPTGINGVLDFFMKNPGKVGGFIAYVRSVPYNDNPEWKPNKIAKEFGINSDLLKKMEKWIRLQAEPKHGKG
jgi:hypothetical protein